MVELLVAVAVLALMSALLLQMVGVSSSVMSFSSKKLDGLASARFSLDRIGHDLAAFVDREEFPVHFEKNPGNDTLTFYSEVGGYSSDRKISTVGYRVFSPLGDTPKLERGIRSEGWTDTLPKATPNIGDLEFDILTEGVLRLEFAYITRSGEFISDRSLTDLSDVSAIVVAIAVLDASSRKLLTTDQVEQISAVLADPPTANGKDLISDWERQLHASGLPLKAIQSVRIFQRYYYVR